MPRQYDPSTIPDVGSFFPTGAYELEIEELNEELSSTNKAMVRGVFRSVGPDLIGVPHFENFVLGSDADPNADDPNTLKQSIGARTLVHLLKKAGVELVGDLEAECQAAIGQHVIGVMSTFTEPPEKKGAANQYAGQVRNKVQFFALGERDLGMTAEAPPAPAAAPAPAGRRAAPPVARAAAPAPAAAPPAGRAAAPPAGRAAAPPARVAAPAPAGRPAATPAPAARAAAPPKAQWLTCQLCPADANQVERKDFAAHMAAHEAAEE